MDFRLEGLVGSGPSSAPDAPADPPKAESKVFGSGPFKQGRPHSSVLGGDEEWRSLKLVRTVDDLSVHKEMLKDAARSYSTDSIASLFSDAQHRQQMLSFSSLTSSSSSTSSHILETVTNSRAASLAMPYLSYAPFSCNSLAGFGSGNLYGGSMPVVLMGTRGPFTPSQWIELEHQALIYKYITANIPVPSNLLIPIKNALDSTSFSCIPGRYLRSNSLGWGSFHLGFSNTGDPEPGRCRRTDGKKWRCSKDVVADQKYCEKHMNRGRHRSRKPVEGQNGHPVTGTTTTASKMPVVTPASAVETLAAVVPGCGASDSLATMAHHQQMMKSLHPCVLSDDGSLKRFCVHRGNTNDQKQNLNDLFPMMKQQSTYEDMSRKQFTLDNSYSLFDSPNKNSSLLDCRGVDSSQDLDGILELGTPCGSAHQFINNRPDNSVNQSNTYLPILMPLVSSDMNSATSSPTNDKASLLPLRVSPKSDQLNMNLGVVATIYGEPIHKQNISWESSQGGPLGEVLHQTSNIANNNVESKNSSLLTLMKEGWDYSPSMGSSPRGVLQKTAFHTHSNSSGGSSPCTENKSVDGINEHLSSSRANPSSLPAL